MPFMGDGHRKSLSSYYISPSTYLQPTPSIYVILWLLSACRVGRGVFAHCMAILRIARQAITAKI